MFFALPYSLFAQWAVQPSGADAVDFHAVSALSDKVAWVAGEQGTVLHTDDGVNWRRCAMPDEAAHLDFRGVQAFNDKTALVMSTGKGELSRVYRTVDGCRTWEMVFENPDPDGALRSLSFQYRPAVAPATGYFAFGVLIGQPVGGEFQIFTSRNYGTTWQPLHDDEGFAPGPSAVAAPGEVPFGGGSLSPLADGNSFAFVTAGGEGARLLYPSGETYDFDHVAMKYSFAQIRLPMPAGKGAGAYSVGARPAAAGRVDLMVVGGDPVDPDTGAAVFVRHGGPALKGLVVSRAVPSMQPPRGPRTAVAFDGDGRRWIAVGLNGTDVSVDDGRTWSPVSPLPGQAADADKGWEALSLPFVVGPHGRIGKLQGPASHALLAGR